MASTTDPQPRRTERRPAVALRIDYPDRVLDRSSSALRLVFAVPIGVLLALVAGGGAGLLVLPTMAMLVVRRKYPRWFFDFNRELLRFSTRVGAYCLLMDDRYPSADEEQGVHLELAYPDARRDLDRWLPLVKWLLVIPHYVVLAVLWVGAIGAVLWAWIRIVSGGRYPQGAFSYLTAVLRWQLRVTAYAFVLTTDEYPPFRLDREPVDGAAPAPPAASPSVRPAV